MSSLGVSRGPEGYVESKVCSDMWNSRCVGCQRSKGVCGSRVCSDFGGL